MDAARAGLANELTSAVANRILAVVRTGARLEVCAAAAGITRRTLGNWLNRSDHRDFALFQQHFAEAEAYAELAAVKVIFEGMQTDI